MRQWIIAAAVSIGVFTQGLAQDAAEVPLIYVTGEAEVKAVPDLLIVSLGVATQARTVAEAREQNAQRMQSVTDAVKKLGIPAGDISTSHFAVNPQYDYQERRTPPRIVGYSVSNQATVRLEDIDRASDLLDRALEAGANSIGNLTFTVKDPAKLKVTAYEQAVRDAQSKAQILARAAGVQVGKIHRLRESGGSPVPVMREFALMAAAPMEKRDTPIEPGEVTVQVRVEIQFEIRQ